MNARLRTAGFATLIAASFVGPAPSQQGAAGPQNPDEIFRQLDVNGDGKLTVDEGGPGGQQFVRRLLEMAKKSPSDSISRDELRRLAEQHRRGNAGGQNAGGSSPNTARPETRAPEARAPEGRRDTSPPATGSSNSSGSRRSRGTSRPTNSSSGGGERTNGTLQARLAGTWRGWVVDGRGENPDTGHMEMELRVEGNRMIGREIGTMRAPQGLGDGTFTIDGDTEGDSGTLDAVSTSGQHKGRSYPGIFALADGTLRWCVNNRNGDRPSEFETGRGNYFMILKKQ